MMTIYLSLYRQEDQSIFYLCSERCRHIFSLSYSDLQPGEGISSLDIEEGRRCAHCWITLERTTA